MNRIFSRDITLPVLCFIMIIFVFTAFAHAQIDIGSHWLFYGDSQTDGRATAEPTALSHVEAFNNIWKATFGTIPDVDKSGVGGCTIQDSENRYADTGGRGSATFVHFQESGNQNKDGQRTVSEFAASFEAFVNRIHSESPNAVISTETAYSFQREDESYRDWTDYNTALLNKVAEFQTGGIQVYVADVDTVMKELVSTLGFTTVITDDGGHFRGVGNLLVALMIYHSLGYDVNTLDLSAVTDITANDKTLCITIINNYSQTIGPQVEDVIKLLKVLVGFNDPVTLEDIDADENGKADLRDAVYDLQKIAGLSP